MKVTKQGRIIKGIGGFYTVLADDGSTCVCKARGLFRKQAKTPLVGDIVEFSYDEEREKENARLRSLSAMRPIPPKEATDIL